MGLQSSVDKNIYISKAAMGEEMGERVDIIFQVETCLYTVHILAIENYHGSFKICQSALYFSKFFFPFWFQHSVSYIW